MSTIILVYLPNLTAENQTLLLEKSKVGRAAWVESGETIIYTRLRNITEADINAIGLSKWKFPPRTENELTPNYNARVKNDTIAAFANMQAKAHDCIFVSEAGFQNLSRQPEFIAS